MCSSSKSFKFFFTNGDVPVQSSYWNYPLEEEESREENQSMLEVHHHLKGWEGRLLFFDI